ncbi:MAG: TIGR03619 family F420-dependent LLM class oxidoreductase [Novosphingobium sp.]|nr:TIGR03619 family F420-dependent LLM class oxidoreductase [Novosphingobium sp.]
MKFSVALPIHNISPGEFQTPQAAREVAAALEAAGAHAGYLTDHPAPSAEWLHQAGLAHDALDPFTALAFVAAATDRLLLHTNVIVMAYRNPFLTAKSAASLQVLSGGRLLLGCGAGYMKAEFEALGVDFHKRGKLFDEALDVIAQVWSGGPVTYQGMNFSAPGNEARPVPNPKPLIWIGGGSDKAMERAALKADGWSPVFASPAMSTLNRKSAIQSVEQLAEKIARLHALRDRAGRSGPFSICVGARARIDFGRPGGAQALLDEVHELEAIGVDWLFVQLPERSRSEWIEHVQWFGEEVLALQTG